MNSNGYHVVSYRNGRLYTESPEEQGRAEGPRLLRLFTEAAEANRYREAIEAYLGENLRVDSLGLQQVKRAVRQVKQGVKIAICQMGEGEWPTTVQVVTTGSFALN